MLDKIKIVIPGSNNNEPILVVPAERESMMVHPVKGLISGRAMWHSLYIEDGKFINRNGIIGQDRDTLIIYALSVFEVPVSSGEVLKAYQEFCSNMESVREVDEEQLLSILELVGMH